MFPTPVGMNRVRRLPTRREHSVPHARGDEPGGDTYLGQTSYVFPTPVGMNRLRCLLWAR